jgi:hypothetical protein
MRQAPAAFILALIAFSNFYFQGGSSADGSVQQTVVTNSRGEGTHFRDSGLTPNTLTCDPVESAFEELFGTQDTASSVKSRTLRFLIATVPDPVHTHLALEFDRLVEGIQQAAAESDYRFQSLDRASLPWPTSLQAGSSDQAEISAVKSASQTRYDLRLGYEKPSGACPGLLIFRKQLTQEEVESFLLVLLVGEKPTGGLDANQFMNALRTVEQSKPSAGIIGILGPNFSGSFSSLDRLLSLIPGVSSCTGDTRPTPLVSPFFVIRSSSAMSNEEINLFRARNYCHASLMSFFDTVEDQQRAIMYFLNHEQGVKPSLVAVLSEDETVFGNISLRENSPGVNVYFPRGIANLRTAYQEEASSVIDPATNRAPRNTLKPDLGTSGEDDTVPTYDSKHVPLSQEGVLQEIIRTLRQHRVTHVIIRATDVMDTLFLAEHLRKNYPDGRLIALDADLLARRDTDDNTLRGMLAVSNYPPFQGFVDHNVTKTADIHRIFADSIQQGEFNATLELIKETDKPWEVARSHSGPKTIPEAHYAGFMAPKLDGVPHDPELRPWLWFSVVGRDGYWPLAVSQPGEVRANPSAKGPCEISIAGHEEHVACGPTGAGELQTTGYQENKSDRSSLRLPWRKLFARDPRDRDEDGRRKLLDKGSVLNGLVIFLLTAISAIFVHSSWRGSVATTGSAAGQYLGPLRDQRRLRLLMTGNSVLLVAWFLSVMSWIAFIPCAVLAASSIYNAQRLRADSRREALLFAAATFAAVAGLYFLVWPENPVTQFMLLFRADHFISGLSPNLPLLVMCGGVLWWIWYQLKARASFDSRRPLLPRGDGLTQIPSHDRFDNAAFVGTLLLTPHFVILAAGVVLVLSFQQLRLHSLEGTNADLVYNLTLCFGFMLLLNSLYCAWVCWTHCRDLLIALNRTPLRYTFMDIRGFEWRRVWGLSGADSGFAYRPLVRAWQALQRLYKSLDKDDPRRDYLTRGNDKLVEVAAQLAGQLEPIRMVLAKIDDEQSNGAASESASPVKSLSRLRYNWRKTIDQQLQFNEDFSNRIQIFQSQLSGLATAVYHCVIEDYWRRDRRSVTRDPDKKTKGSEVTGEARKILPVENVPPEVQWAEEFVSLVYVSFIIRVLVRIRWLGMAALGIYLALLLAVAVYPFEPKGTIHAFFVFLFLAMLCTIGIIYGQMHRDDTLSHLTDTQPGQLGGDYWWRMVSFAGVPLFTLITTQVPQLSRTLFFWVKPLLDGLGKG